jgi:Rrf2 family protein
MRFSIKTQYGIQAMLELALKYGGGPCQIREIAKSQKIPIRYLEQLLLLLKRRGLVSSTRGKKGGYNLVKHPSDVSVLEMVEALEGPIELTNKKMKRSPAVYEAFNKIEANVKADLKGMALEDLVFRKRKEDRALLYNI